MASNKNDAGRVSGSLTRRSALKIGAGAATFSVLGMPSILRAQSSPIRIGHLTPMTGFLGTLGRGAVEGITMAVEEVNAAGGVNGRKIDFSTEDSINPETAATKAQRLMERDNVDFIMGEISSASSLAISEVAKRNKKLFMALGPRSDVLRGERCTRYMFCTDLPNTAMVNAVGGALKRQGLVSGKRLFTMTADYVFGHDLLSAAKKFMAANGADHVGDELIATDVNDFSAFLLKIRQARPDVVCVNLAGNQVSNFIKQYNEFGLPFQLAGFALNTENIWAAGAGNFSGIWPAVWYHDLETEGSMKFVNDFKAKYGKIPENHAWVEYIAFKCAVQAIKETGSSDSEDIINYFESEAELDILKGRPGYFRKEDHQLMQEAYSLEAKAEGTYSDVFDSMAMGDPVPGPGESLESIFPSVEGGACKL